MRSLYSLHIHTYFGNNISNTAVLKIKLTLDDHIIRLHSILAEQTSFWVMLKVVPFNVPPKQLLFILKLFSLFTK